MSAPMNLTLTLKNVLDSAGPTTRGHTGTHDDHEDGLDPRLRNVATLTSTGATTRNHFAAASHCAA